MPTIQQENGVKTVAGLPLRWGRRAYRELSSALSRVEVAKAALHRACADLDRVGPGGEDAQYGEALTGYDNLSRLLDEVTAAPFPIDATDAHLCVLAERYASDCATHGATIHEPAALRARLASICRLYGIEPPTVRDDAQTIARCVDPAWWRRNLRRVHGRAFEAAAIRLGFVSVRAGAYASDETVKRRNAQTARNRAALDAVKIKNEHGYECTLTEAASKTTSNKRIRRGELMLRLAGCEAVAKDLDHVGIFVTMTAPAKYHAVLQKSGEINPKFNDSTPRQVQGYLQTTWARSRTDYGRHNIKPYGFRIAEPHHDGCVHWHALLFMPAHKVRRFQRIVQKHFLAEDGNEPGAQANRVKFERIDPKKGSAAAYIAKYISKNIDDDSEDAHDEVIGPDGEPVKIAMPANAADRASQRVDAWAGVWGIRQFQPIGQPPVTVWREIRRVSKQAIANAPENIKAAWNAAQREYGEADKETGECKVVKPADYAAYIRAQGGVCTGRDYAIGIAKETARVEGRYGVTEALAPVGICARVEPGKVYASTRYTWERVQAGVAVRRSWSPVNNCTASVYAPPDAGPCRDVWFATVSGEPVAEFDETWFDTEEYRAFLRGPVEVAEEMLAAEIAAAEKDARTVWTVPSYAHREWRGNGRVGKGRVRSAAPVRNARAAE